MGTVDIDNVFMKLMRGEVGLYRAHANHKFPVISTSINFPPSPVQVCMHYSPTTRHPLILVIWPTLQGLRKLTDPAAPVTTSVSPALGLHSFRKHR